MQKHPQLTQERCLRFAEKLTRLFYPCQEPVGLSVFSAPDRIPYPQAVQGDYRKARIGEKFGPPWSTHWFRVDISIPADWQGREVHFLWDSTSEALVWVDGTPAQGLTGSYSTWANDSIRKEYRLTQHVQGNEAFNLYVEMACNGLFGLDNGVYSERTGELRQAEVALFDRSAWNLYWDLKVIADMARHLPANTPRAGQALYTANAMVNAIRLDDPSTWAAAQEIASRFFGETNGDGQHNLSAVGHAHIDTAWLWPIAETRRKCARTFASALRYMEDYPEYRFACSQAQQFEWMKESYPELFERMRSRIQEGRFIPTGGTWVEPDCNIPSGESLVRQFLFGQRFFQREFGRKCSEFWNPDVFGYSGALPQIMRQAGIKYFLTQKLSWNQFNKPSSHTFMWEGIDGSQVLTHFPPADTYNAEASVKDVVYNVSNFKDHERAKESYLLFGYGDGGGGPTPAMLEQIRRMKDVDGLPRVEIRSPEEFFTRCAADLKDPTIWVGELYFELHRGTYTSQAHNKRFNRQGEFLLHDIEFLSALAYARQRAPYPTDEINKLWKWLLTNQFHDIIPGSSIHEVYQDSTEVYHALEQRGVELREETLQELCGDNTGSQLLAFNTLSIPRQEVVELPEGLLGQQTASDGRSLAVVETPAMGYSLGAAEAGEANQAWAQETAGTIILENKYVQATFDRRGCLISFIDKRIDRQCLAKDGLGNRFVLYEDEPLNWDAWDVDVFHLEKPLDYPGADSVRLIENGPLRVAIEFEVALSHESSLTQVVSLTSLSPRLDFSTRVTWQEKHRFLKVEFPLNVRAEQAAYEIQFGHLHRPTHFNTTWDLARFEVCGHKWADLSEAGFGVALLNDCKYGYAAHGNLLRLSLLRSPTNPDAHADEGLHNFRYALFPHPGSLQEANVIQEALCFNVPLLLARSEGKPSSCAYFQVNSSSVVIDTVKRRRIQRP